MSKARLRKAQCSDCGYVIRVTRSWLEVGLPTCPCGGEIAPTEPADLAFIGRITDADMPARQWTVICRENGWDDAILRKGNAQRAYETHKWREGPRKVAHAEFCEFAGCGKWVSAGETHCTEHGQPVGAMPF